MSVENVLAGLAVVENRIKGVTNGVNHVYDYPPNSLNSADLPCFVNIPGKERVRWDGGSDEAETAGLATRVYHCLLYVIPRAAGVSGEVVKVTVPVLDVARTIFQSSQTLGGQKFIMSVNYLGDSGVRELKYASSGGMDMGYMGVEFQVEVTERIVAYYASGE